MKVSFSLTGLEWLKWCNLHCLVFPENIQQCLPRIRICLIDILRLLLGGRLLRIPANTTRGVALWRFDSSDLPVANYSKLQRPHLTLPLKAEQENPQWSKVAFNLVLNSKQTAQTSLGISVINCPLFSAKLARKLDDPSPAALSRGWWTFMVGRRTSSTVPKNSHIGWDSPPKPT